ncbi:MAG: alginate lyase family protein, partial [Planctomycetes bacterium]|nr:alginate lyase family protein [Planctomycetota bacterium]
MLRRLVAAAHYLTQQGPRIALFRARYALSRKTGRLAKRFPAYCWSDRPLSYWVRSVPTEPAEYRRYRESLDRRFFFPPGQIPSIEPSWLTGAVEQADPICRGTFSYFSAEQASLGDPPDWLLNPFTKRRADLHHWTRRGDFDSQLGDIKYIWEPSRFGWVYTLARAYAATGNEEYPACFWRFVESWRASNPPQCGPNWQCGQEVALRTMASVWGLHAFWSSPHSTDERISMLAVVVASSAERIAGNIDFARALRSNHTISEAAGLYTVGVLFPEFAQADRWRAMGKSLLDGECLEQFYADGSYIQHSLNYQRLVLQVYTWVVRLAELNGDSFTANTRSLLDRSVRFLWNVQDEKSGCAPNYGHNDGALTLPLNSCGYLDYRPAIGAMHYALHAQRLYDPGPWDEDLQWLFGESSSRPAAQDAGSTDRSPTSMQARDGGYYTLRGRESWAMVRCHTYRDRPVQADMLHMDLWWRGLNILRDSGTYRYNCEQPWLDYFQGTSAHNTVVVDGQDQMRRSGHFMWLHWTRSTVRYHQPLADGEIEYWEGQHESYRRQPGGIIHRRAIIRLGDHFWVVIDD